MTPSDASTGRQDIVRRVERNQFPLILYSELSVSVSCTRMVRKWMIESAFVTSSANSYVDSSLAVELHKVTSLRVGSHL